MKLSNKAQFGMFIVGAIAFIFACLAAWPKYVVYYSKMAGEAKLAHAQYEREVQVRDAEGKKEAAVYLAQVDVERAEGVAKANAIIGSSLKNNEAYLRWLYVESLKEKTGAEVIYVPTEAGLPILEAGKRK